MLVCEKLTVLSAFELLHLCTAHLLGLKQYGIFVQYLATIMCAYIIDMILGRICLLQNLHFTLLYVVVSISSYYLTSCLNAHNHNTCIHLPQTGSTARKMAVFVIRQDR